MSPATTLPSKFSFFFLLSLLTFLSVTKSDELDLVLTIKTAFQNSNTNLFDSWGLNKSLCTFSGITCNELDSVKEIELSNKHLSGSFPFDSICKLKSLDKLSLGDNYIVGPVTQDLNNCTQLQYLDLGNNNFSGLVPDISSLSKLTTLHLNKSEFIGVFPWNSLENMTNLSVLSLGDNQFNRTQFPSQILKLKKLTWLYLSATSIEGKIPPEIGNLTELVNLELSANYLSGEIPAEISNLGNLWQLELYQNDLTGKIPVGLRNLTNLQNFDASTNYLEGDISELKYMTQLMTIQLFENELSGEVPPEFGDFKNLVSLSLYTNKFTGTVPENLGSWADFVFIDISENMFSGLIPPNMCKNGKMEELLILQNKFVGEIPENYASCTSLRRFRVNNNSLSGKVPGGLWGLPNVTIIDVAMNNLEGSITSQIGDAKSLAELNVAKNKFSGELPMEISEASSFVKIDLSSNQFSGRIPDSIGKLKELTSLHLEANMLSGSIPSSLGSCKSLTDLNIAHNSLSGDIPASLGDLPTLNSLNISTNQLSGVIPSTLSSLKLSSLDLSNNRLSGVIPQALSYDAYNGSFAGNDGLCSQNIKFFRRCSSKSGATETRTLVACFVVGSVVLLVSLACYLHLRKSVKDIRKHSLKEDSWDVKSFHVLTFTEDEILDSIKQENLVGKGGSGNVYRVLLPNDIELAVKHIWHSDFNVRKNIRTSSPMLSSKKNSPEFDAEVQTLSSIRHVNVVKLYCSITSQDSSLLVYEYMPNGSLWDRLHTCEKMVLDWNNRYEIALGAAKGLEYLHHSCEKPVIHRDVKSSNILLDEFMKPRIADFGLAKVVQANATSNGTTHVVAGTHGYIAPEYGYTYKVNEKSDVYSFGVVLMELVSGKRPIEPEYGDNKDIVSWVCSKLKTKETVVSVVDSRIRELYKEEAIKVLKIAILCTARQPALRPTMRTVVQMLEDAEPGKLFGIVASKDGGSKKEDHIKNNDKL